MKDLFYKVMENAREGITISDATQPDNPLIYVNKGFINMTGYTFEESVGKNCRYLQGADTTPAQIELIRQAIKKREPVQLELINYKKNGEPFWNYFSLTPIVDDFGHITHFIGIQEDNTIRKEKARLEDEVSRTKLIALSTVRAQEDERTQIGRELHDNINQMVAAISLYMDIAASDGEQRMGLIKRTKKLTHEIIAETRKFSKALVGPAFEEITFKSALWEMVESIQMAVPYQIRVTDEAPDEALLSANQKLVLFRIILNR
ncbi:MAG: PAS domain-containing protein [Chitinophagaceae bacterium]